MAESKQNELKTPKTERPRPSWTRSRPILVYLLLLVVVIVIPALVVSLVLLNRTNESQQDVVRNLTNATVQAIGQSVDRELSGMVTTLRVLATSSLLVDGDLDRFHERATQALAGTGAYVIALGPNFEQLLNTRVPFGTPLGSTSDPASAAETLERGVATVSSLFFGQTAQKWVFNVLLPVPEKAQVSLLVLTQNAANLTVALQSRALPAGWHAALIDKENIVIAATADSGMGNGDVLPMRQTLSDVSEEWRRERFGGDNVVTAEWRSGLSGWRVVAWASDSVVDRPLGDALLWLALWSAVLALAAGSLVFMIGKRVSASVRGLRRDAQRLGRGETVEAKDYPVSEIAEVSLALAEASRQRQAAEQEVKFLMREVAHRSKNQMTVIAAMAKQTARGASDVPSYVQAFEKRILGLARSTDLLLTHGSAGVDLGELINSQLAPFSPSEGARIHVSGPQVRLNVQAAQILGMAAHELATNAVKYGAFAGEAGQLAVNWSAGDECLEFIWREKVPGPLPQSDRVGFGTTVLKSMVGRSLGADVERLCHDDGIEWRFSVPRDAIAPDRVDPLTDAFADE